MPGLIEIIIGAVLAYAIVYLIDLKFKLKKCDMCGDQKENIQILQDIKNKLSLNACDDCIEYAFESAGIPNEKV